MGIQIRGQRPMYCTLEKSRLLQRLDLRCVVLNKFCNCERIAVYPAWICSDRTGWPEFMVVLTALPPWKPDYQTCNKTCISLDTMSPLLWIVIFDSIDYSLPVCFNRSQTWNPL